MAAGEKGIVVRRRAFDDGWPRGICKAYLVSGDDLEGRDHQFVNYDQGVKFYSMELHLFQQLVKKPEQLLN